MVTKCWAGLVILLPVVAAVPVEAQFLFEENRWGAHLSFTPEWQTPGPFRHFLGAEEIVDWSGSDYTVGFVRGGARRGEWGLALVRQRVAADSLLCLAANDAGSCSDPVRATDDLRLQGFEFHWFTPLARFVDDRVQLGVNAALGAGWYQGTILRPSTGPGPMDVGNALRFRRGESSETLQSRSRCSGSRSP